MNALALSIVHGDKRQVALTYVRDPPVAEYPTWSSAQAWLFAVSSPPHDADIIADAPVSWIDVIVTRNPDRDAPSLTGKEEIPEESLDPADWDRFAILAHKALDQAIAFVRTARDRPVWQNVPEAVRVALKSPVPVKGENLDLVYREFEELILPYSTGNTHPRFFGWVHGTGMATGIVAEMLSAAMNANCGGRDHGAIYVEKAVLNWCKSVFDFPLEASGLIVSGTAMANLIAATVARNAADVVGIRTDGVASRPAKMVAYASSEIHECVVKAMEILGLGSNSLRRIPVDADFQMDVGALAQTVVKDRAEGYEPFLVVGTAGTVNTGAIDDLDALASLCAEERLWFHVDGAFGALGVLDPGLKSRLKGIERADSLAFDFHKWMHVPYDAGCVLVRHGNLHRETFSTHPDYLSRQARGLSGGESWPTEYGPELSRCFRALKIWFALKEHGTEQFGRLIAQNCAQARYLGQVVDETAHLERLAPISLNIVCFRYKPGNGELPPALDRLNEAIVADLQEAGIAAPSTTRIRGQIAIRVNITNHRTRRADLDLLIRSILAAGARQPPP